VIIIVLSFGMDL